MYPLVRELAADGIPVSVTCRVLKIARQPYYRWLAYPVTDAELVGPIGRTRCSMHIAMIRSSGIGSWSRKPGYGEPMAERTAWRICSQPAGGRRSGRSAARAAGRRVRRSTRTCAVVDDKGRVSHQFVATSPNGCGSPTSPSTGPVRASSTFARSRTSTPTGSSATRSTHG